MVDYTGLIKKKRDGGEHDEGELRALVEGFLSGDMPDYQMSAWLMAVVFRGLGFDETLTLTDIEVASGERLDLSRLGRPVVDKHSTGGVGDKVTLVLAPLVASCGAIFGKMSGRGLAHTGGTIDKLESIPGFRSELSPAEFLDQLGDVGVCVAAQSAGMVPADGKLYALRDVTATVESNPLVAASIMSKKIASGTATVIMDIKVGQGAFLRNRGQAAGVFHLMQRIGRERGIEVRGLMTPMDAPLGYAVGNALEVKEAVEALRGEGAPDLVAVVTRLAVMALEASDAGLEGKAAEAEVSRRLADGSALGSMRAWIESQGGDASFIDDSDVLPRAETVLPVSAENDGRLVAIDALAVGTAMLELGAGRRRKGEAIDPSVGLRLRLKPGDSVAAGETIAEVHAGSKAAGAAAVDRIRAACVIGEGEAAAVRAIEEL